MAQGSTPTHGARRKAPGIERIEDLVDRSPRTVIDRIGGGPDALRVHEHGRLRWMQFGDGPVQSLMDVESPHDLVLPYTRALMASLLFDPAPSRVLLLGLGGGSLARFLLHHFPGARITAVESCAAAVDVAARHFHVAHDPDRCRVVECDARRAVEEIGERFDLVLVDLFDVDGLPPWVCAAPFQAACAERLSAHGVLAVNLWVDDADEFLTVIGGIRRVHGGRNLVLDVEGYRNLVALAFPGTPRETRLPALYRTARDLRARTAVDAPGLLDRIRAANPVADDRLVL